jgi:hypothetical protein
VAGSRTGAKSSSAGREGAEKAAVAYITFSFRRVKKNNN